MDDSSLRLDEASARQLVLVRAIDEIDTQGRLLSEVERERLERDALEASRRLAPGVELDRGHYLRQRTARVLAAVHNREPEIAALQGPEPWRRSLLWLLPALACVAGAALDRIDNPQQVNMLSPALLGVLFWNIGVYLVLLVSLFVPPRPPAAVGPLQRWLAGLAGAGRRGGRLRADIHLRLQQHWHRLTARQQSLWWKQLLHLTAAGWAVGLAISIILGGLVRQYRVGWESTLLGVEHVHAFLRLLFAPVVALFPFEPFSLADLQRMAFASGAAIGVEEARRWVWMYLALLALVVVLPRLALAAWAAARRRVLGRAVRIDLRDPYYVELLARVSPARVTLAISGRSPRGRALLLRVLQQAADRPPSPGQPGPWPVLTTTRGDVLRAFEIPPDFQPPAPMLPHTPQAASAAEVWLQELVARFRAPRRPRGQPDGVQASLTDTDLVVLLPEEPGQLRQATRLLHWVAQPAVVLAPQEPGQPALLEPWRAEVQRLGLAAEVIPLQEATAHWLREPLLVQAIAGRLAPSKRTGFGRLAQAWAERHEERFAAAMQLLAELVVRAARETEETAGAPAGLRQWVHPGEREADQRARDLASQVLLQRLRTAEGETFAELVHLHRLDAAPAVPAARPEQDRLVLQQAVDTPQAGMAGAATGAAVGAGIDLVTGGLTLGAAAALGAVVGGGVGFVTAAWKNRGAPGGQSQVQLGEDMLQAVTEDALLGYLAVAHRLQRLAGEALVPPAWRSEVIAAVAGRRRELALLWAEARHGADDEGLLRQRLAGELGALARGLLGRL